MIGTLLRLLFGFIVACLVGGAVKVAFALTPLQIVTDDPERLAQMGLLTLFAATHIAVFSAPFALVVAALGEWRGIRSWAYYALAGLGIAIAGFAVQYSSEAPGQSTIVNNYALTAFLTAGLLGGIGYWLFAGRGAGGKSVQDASATPRPRIPPKEATSA